MSSQYIGANKSKFIVSNIDIEVNVGDIIFPKKNPRVRCTILEKFDNGVAAVLERPDTYIPNDYLKEGVEWALSIG